MKAYGEETHSLNPSVTFIPTIVLNKKQGRQKDILKNLLKEVCSMYTVSSWSIFINKISDQFLTKTFLFRGPNLRLVFNLDIHFTPLVFLG